MPLGWAGAHIHEDHEHGLALQLELVALNRMRVGEGGEKWTALAGIADPSEVRQAYVELDGSMSVKRK